MHFGYKFRTLYLNTINVFSAQLWLQTLIHYFPDWSCFNSSLQCYLEIVIVYVKIADSRLPRVSNEYKTVMSFPPQFYSAQ